MIAFVRYMLVSTGVGVLRMYSSEASPRFLQQCMLRVTRTEVLPVMFHATGFHRVCIPKSSLPFWKRRVPRCFFHMVPYDVPKVHAIHSDPPIALFFHLTTHCKTVLESSVPLAMDNLVLKQIPATKHNQPSTNNPPSPPSTKSSSTPKTQAS